MKKLFLMLAVAMLTVSANAQKTAVTANKAGDNWYIGINAGVATPVSKFRVNLGGAEDYGFMKGVSPEFGVRVGKNLTTVFGLALDINNYFGNKSDSKSTFGSKTFINATDFDILSTWNLSNAFAGYKGEPRSFEVIGLIGGGYSRAWAEKQGGINAKAALDFAFNLGEAKAWQVYVEPSITWALNGFDGEQKVAYDVNKSFVQLNAGVVYKFNTSNGTHNFKIVKPYDQAEIDQLNSTINDLRNELAKKPKEVVKEVVKEAPSPQMVKVENLVFVTFAQGKSTLTKEAKKALDGVKSGKHVQIVGTASPEGSKEINDKLSQARADEVAKYLKNNGVVVDEATGKGVQGNTSNRLAVVYVK